jgi:hypothetical protein
VCEQSTQKKKYPRVSCASHLAKASLDQKTKQNKTKRTLSVERERESATSLLIAVVTMVEKRIDFSKLDFGVLLSPLSFASLDSFVEKLEIRIAIVELDPCV